MTLIALWWLIPCYLTCNCVTFNLSPFRRARGAEPVSRGTWCWSCVYMCAQLHLCHWNVAITAKKIQILNQNCCFSSCSLANKEEPNGLVRASPQVCVNLCSRQSYFKGPPSDCLLCFHSATPFRQQVAANTKPRLRIIALQNEALVRKILLPLLPFCDCFYFFFNCLS